MNDNDNFKRKTAEEMQSLAKKEGEEMRELIETIIMMKAEPDGEELISTFLHGTCKEFISMLKINELINTLKDIKG